MRPRSFSFTGIVLLVFSVLALSVVTASSVFCAGQPESKEAKLGREGARLVEKESKLITDPKVLERVQRIGQQIAEVANTVHVKAAYGNADVVKFNYTFKVVDDKTVNAFSLPGGYVYVNKGLLDYVQSDHELAAVLAHECAHAAHHHMLQLLKAENKMDSQIMLVLLAGLLGGAQGNSMGNLLIGAELFRVAKANGYGRKAESDADSTAVAYLSKAGYNPVGMLTFLERLDKESGSKPTVELGILQTHPEPHDRCRDVLQEIETMGLPVNRRAVTKCVKAETVPSYVKGLCVTHVMLDGSDLFDPMPLGGDVTSAQRAAYISAKINQFLDKEPTMREVTIGLDGKSVLAAGQPVLVVTQQDSDFCGKPAERIAAQVADGLKRVLWRETISRAN